MQIPIITPEQANDPATRGTTAWWRVQHAKAGKRQYEVTILVGEKERVVTAFAVSFEAARDNVSQRFPFPVIGVELAG